MYSAVYLMGGQAARDDSFERHYLGQEAHGGEDGKSTQKHDVQVIHT
jgi:hypothetical protein